MEEEESQPLKKLSTPCQPTQSEYDDHSVTHCPYRSWCTHCREGRGQEFGHSAVEKDPRRVPLIAFDYAGISDKGEVRKVGSELQFEPGDESATRILVIKDDKSQYCFAHVVPCKGVDKDRFTVECIVNDIIWMGYTKVMLKCDNEPAILKLLVEALWDLRVKGELEQVMTEHPPPYDPQCNGVAESAVKSWKGMFRTHKSALEERLGVRVPVRHPLIAWLVKFAADILSWQVRGHDAQTPYQRLRGKVFRSRLMGIGEACSYKIRSQEPLTNSPEAEDFTVDSSLASTDAQGSISYLVTTGLSSLGRCSDCRTLRNGIRMAWRRLQRRPTPCTSARSPLSSSRIEPIRRTSPCRRGR